MMVTKTKTFYLPEDAAAELQITVDHLRKLVIKKDLPRTMMIGHSNRLRKIMYTRGQIEIIRDALQASRERVEQ